MKKQQPWQDEESDRINAHGWLLARARPQQSVRREVLVRDLEREREPLREREPPREWSRRGCRRRCGRRRLLRHIERRRRCTSQRARIICS